MQSPTSNNNTPVAAGAPHFGSRFTPNNNTGNSLTSNVSDPREMYISKPVKDHSSTKAYLANVPPEGVRLGIACMKKKATSATMQAFIRLFEAGGMFTVVQFSEKMLLEEPVEAWPNVDCAIMFFSQGFPLDKACQYFHQHRRDTFFLTEPPSQKVLLDRRDFLQALRHNNIPLPPNHMCANRDGYRGAAVSVVEEFIEEEYITIDGRRLDKPFVEKPVDAEDHNVFIYFPKRMGGGCRKMFRKVKDKSSSFDADGVRVRRDGSFVYESFVEAANSADIKCYTVGAEFVHAESRKAPVVDGVVDRDETGKERRYEVQLHAAELMVARKITKVFRQLVCGFDLLRVSDTEFYVCDVNGWSFVKNNDKYVERAVTIMREIFLKEVARRGLHRLFKRTAKTRELLGVVGVFRHGDRTPKQKLKLVLQSRRIIDVAFEGVGTKREEVVVKGDTHPKMELLAQAIRDELAALNTSSTDSTPDAAMSSSTKSPSPARRKELLERMLDVTSRRHEGLKLQVKPKKFDSAGECIEAQLVCKWGGWLTAAGEKQSQVVGKHFVDRVFGNELGPNYLRNVSVTTNNERRVMNTARHFVDCVTEPMTRPVDVDEKLLGDNSNAKEHLEAIQERVSRAMHVGEPEAVAELREQVPAIDTVTENVVLEDDERTPIGALRALHRLLSELVHHVNHTWRETATPLYRDEPLGLLRQRWSNLLGSYVLRSEESAGDGPVYDVSKLTDVFDYASYDVCYNQRAFHPVDLYPLFTLAQALSAFVSEAEAGFDRETKFVTGALVGQPLLTTIYGDLVNMALGETPRTRLYFTSASHVNALRHLLYNCDATDFHHVDSPLELHFLSHFVFKVYRYRTGTSQNATPPTMLPTPAIPTTTVQDAASTPGNPCLPGDSPPTPSGPAPLEAPDAGEGGGHFQIEVHFSTGVDKNMFGIVQGHHARYGAVSSMIRIHNNLTFVDLQRIVQQCQSAFMNSTGQLLNTQTVPRALYTPVPGLKGDGGSPTMRQIKGTSFPTQPGNSAGGASLNDRLQSVGQSVDQGVNSPSSFAREAFPHDAVPPPRDSPTNLLEPEGFAASTEVVDLQS